MDVDGGFDGGFEGGFNGGFDGWFQLAVLGYQPQQCVRQLRREAFTAWLGILIFGSDFWDPHRKQNSNSVFGSEDSGRIFF